MRNLRLTKRDEGIFRDLIHSGGILDSKTIRERWFVKDKSGESCRRRLHGFSEHGILSVVQSKINFGPLPAGRLPAVFSVTPKGADLIEELTGERPPVFSSLLSPHNLEHRLGMAKTRLTFNRAAAVARLTSPLWIGEYDAKAKEPAAPGLSLSERFRLCHQYEIAKDDQPQAEKHVCWPDAACLLAMKSSPEDTPSQLLILWEYDRSTERLQQIARKLLGYHQLFLAKDHRRLFPGVTIHTTRVFFVTETASRRKSIAAAIKNLAAAKRVRLATSSDLSSNTILFSPVWYDVDGTAKTIISRTSRE